jgi:hypothetical protein
MTVDPYVICQGELNLMGSLVVGYLAEEDPITVATRVKVLVFHPFGPFLGVSSFGPSPQHAEDEMVDFLEGFFARYVLVIALYWLLVSSGAPFNGA